MYTAVSPQEALKIVKSNDRVYIHTAAAAPQELINALTARAEELRGVEIVHLHIEGEAPYADEKYRESFRVNSLFVGPNLRHATQNQGNASYVPIFLSEVPLLFRRKIMKIDVALISVSPPDRHGFCSLGVSVEATKAAVDSAKHVIAQINAQMPRSHGDGVIHISQLDSFVEVDSPLPQHGKTDPTDAERQIGKYIAEMIEDGSTLQMGIGAIPDAALKYLKNHKNLGIHSEMISDGVVDLIKSGVINGKNKVSHPGKITCGFALGSRKLYDFIDDNPMFFMADAEWVNDVSNIRKNPKVVAINSAIEVDITGQVCADSIGTKMYSGVGGQMDYIRGAALSEGGKPIIALPSQTHKGISRIVPTLQEGAGVVTTRAHVHYVVTEWGVANLFGKNIYQRIEALINIAHPNHRKWLKETAEKLYHIEESVF
jgi:acyl-CoA hydrolase